MFRSISIIFLSTVDHRTMLEHLSYLICNNGTSVKRFLFVIQSPSFLPVHSRRFIKWQINLERYICYDAQFFCFRNHFKRFIIKNSREISFTTEIPNQLQFMWKLFLLSFLDWRINFFDSIPHAILPSTPFSHQITGLSYYFRSFQSAVCHSEVFGIFSR